MLDAHSFGELSELLLPNYILITFVIKRCEHFSTKLGGTRDHLFSYNISNGLYDLEYLTALFRNDEDAIEEFELTAQTDGFGPLAECSTVANFSTIKVNCRVSLFQPSHILISLITFMAQHGSIATTTESLCWQKWCDKHAAALFAAMSPSMNTVKHARVLL